MSLEDLVQRIPLLAALPADELRRLEAMFRPCSFDTDALVLCEGEQGESLYVLVDGEVDIIKALGTDSERWLGVRSVGTLIGEMSLFSADRRHTASVRARTPLRMLALPFQELELLLTREPAVAFGLVRTLSQRLEQSENLTVRDLLQKNQELTRAYEELKAAQEQLLEKERMEAELQVARSIQRSILPRAQPQLPGFNFGLVFEPVSSVGGDLYDFVPLKGGRLGIAVGDVSGHGVPSALFMTLAFSLLRAEASRSGSPAQVLQRVNRHLLGMNEAGMFVTVLYGILDVANRHFSYARAGHEVPLLISGAGHVLAPLHKVGQPLGLFEDLLLDEVTVAVPQDGHLLVFTDGVTEAADASGRLFGHEGFVSVLSHSARGSAQDLCQAAYDAVVAHCGLAAPQDDILLVAVQAV